MNRSHPIEPSSPASAAPTVNYEAASTSLPALFFPLVAALAFVFGGLFDAISPPVVEYVFDQGAVVDLDAVDEAEPLDGNGQEVIASFTVSSTVATQISSSGVYPSSWQCNNATSTQVFRVNSGDTATTNGIGPYCSTCALGQTFTVPTQTLFLLASGGTPSVQCSRVQSGAFGSSGGISKGFADATYLPLAGGTMTGTETLAPKTCPNLELAFSATANNGICDNASNTRPTWYSNGQQIFEASGVVGFTVSTPLTVSTTSDLIVQERAAPSGAASKTTCYADSTSHALFCDYNNDGFNRETRDVTSVSNSSNSNSTTTMADATGYSVSIGAAGDWYCDLFAVYSETTAADGFKAQLAYSGTASTFGGDLEIIPNGASPQFASTTGGTTPIGPVSIASSTAGELLAHVGIKSASGSGTLKLQFAQNAHTTGSASLLAGNGAIRCTRS